MMASLALLVACAQSNSNELRDSDSYLVSENAINSSAANIKEPRDLYTYYFGGIENMTVEDAVSLLNRLGYSGIGVGARSEEQRVRLDQYYQLSSQMGDSFNVQATMMAHRFGQFGFSDADHKAAIDRMEGKEGELWVWVRDDIQDGSITDEKVENFIRGILDYAVSKGVKIVLYPHYNTYFPTTEEAMVLVNKIDHPSLGVAINLCHEMMSDKGSVQDLKRTFELAKDKLTTVVISGSLLELDRTNVGTMNDSTILSLDDSEYDLRPYMRLIKESDYTGPIGFINFTLSNPEDYLQRTMTRWRELSEEVELFKE